MAGQADSSGMTTELATIPGTALKVSPVALGTWAIGGWMWGGTDEANPFQPSGQHSSTASTSSIPRQSTASAAPRKLSERQSPKGGCGPRRHRHQDRP